MIKKLMFYYKTAKLKDEDLTKKLLDLFQLALARLLLFLGCMGLYYKTFYSCKNSAL
jgi:hypothetical protein